MGTSATGKYREAISAMFMTDSYIASKNTETYVILNHNFLLSKVNCKCLQNVLSKLCL